MGIKTEREQTQEEIRQYINDIADRGRETHTLYRPRPPMFPRAVSRVETPLEFKKIPLRNCPFCGGDAEIATYYNNQLGELQFIVRCTNAGCFVAPQTEEARSVERAVAYWNVGKEGVHELKTSERLEHNERSLE